MKNVWKKKWSTQKAIDKNLRSRLESRIFILYCVSWDHCRIISFQLLNFNQILNADLYSL